MGPLALLLAFASVWEEMTVGSVNKAEKKNAKTLDIIPG